MRALRLSISLPLALMLAAASPAHAELAIDPDWSAARNGPHITAWCASRMPAQGAARSRCETAQLSAGTAVSILARRHRAESLEGRFIAECRAREGADYVAALGCAKRRLAALEQLYGNEPRRRIARMCKARGGDIAACELAQALAAAALAAAKADAADGTAATLLLNACLQMAHDDLAAAQRCAIPQAPTAPAGGPRAVPGAPLR